MFQECKKGFHLNFCKTQFILEPKLIPSYRFLILSKLKENCRCNGFD